MPSPESQCCPNGCERPLGDCVAHLNHGKPTMDTPERAPTITCNIHAEGAAYKTYTLNCGSHTSHVLHIGEAAIFLQPKDMERLRDALSAHLETVAKPRKPVFHSLSACHGCGCSGDDFASPHVEAFELTGELYCEDCADGAIEQWTADHNEEAA